MRGAVKSANQISGAAVGGLVQEIDPAGNVVWEFEYSSETYITHHDITLLPNGNVLLIAWERKELEELQAMGYLGSADYRYATHIIEVAQNGTGGEIVWEWHLWDHMIQDVDPTKPNYGVISLHPELMDINVQIDGFGDPSSNGDWFHVNGIDYNEELDQIAFSSRFLSEIFIIDHSTTTETAAGHSGGNAGKGGDFLYRWGKPKNYGINITQTISGPVHDIRWIEDDGRPRGGFLQFFNNQGVGSTSTVDAINPPLSADGYNYNYTTGTTYAPSQYDFRHFCLNNALGQSASNTMPNGNLFVNLSGSYMYEIDTDGSTIWQYNAGPAKAFRYTCDYPGIKALVEAGAIENLCNLVSTKAITSESIQITPNPSMDIFYLENLSDKSRIQKIEVFDWSGKKILALENTTEIDLSNFSEGMYFVNIQLNQHLVIGKKIAVVR